MVNAEVYWEWILITMVVDETITWWGYWSLASSASNISVPTVESYMRACFELYAKIRWNIWSSYASLLELGSQRLILFDHKLVIMCLCRRMFERGYRLDHGTGLEKGMWGWGSSSWALASWWLRGRGDVHIDWEPIAAFCLLQSMQEGRVRVQRSSFFQQVHVSREVCSLWILEWVLCGTYAGERVARMNQDTSSYWPEC